MITISIETEASNNSEMGDLLRHIAEQLDSGYTSGFHPTWSLEGDEEEDNEDE